MQQPTPAAAPSPAGERDGDAALLAACGTTDLRGVVEQCQQHRRRLGLPVSRWTAPLLLDVLRQAAHVQGRPARVAAGALLAIAADPTTRSPVRLGHDGPWWPHSGTGPVLAPDEVDELDQLDARLHVARRACQLLDEVELTPC